MTKFRVEFIKDLLKEFRNDIDEVRSGADGPPPKGHWTKDQLNSFIICMDQAIEHLKKAELYGWRLTE
jgi:hypothetical protein